MVQYYHDLWERRSNIFAPLTSLVGECGQTKTTKAKGTNKIPRHWDENHQRAFDHVKAIIAKDVVLAYPDYSKVFKIYTDASSKQLGAVITQDNKRIAFFSWKLSDTQHKYSITKVELIAIVETLEEFKGMLWGKNIKVFTDHTNLMRDVLGLTLDQVYQWRLLLEEYGPNFVYIKNIHNTVADSVLRLEYDPSVNQTAESFHLTKVTNRKSLQKQSWMTVSKNWCELDIDSDNLDSYTNKHDDWNLVFAHHEEEDEIYPLTLTEIANAHCKEQELKVYFKKNAKMPQKDIGLHLIEDTKVLCKNGKVRFLHL
jgi:hypothetical protein